MLSREEAYGQTLLEHSKIKKALDRLSGLTTDVRNVYKPFVSSLPDTQEAN